MKQIRIGYLPILDHLIFGVAQELEPELFKEQGIKPLRYKDWETLYEDLLAKKLEGAFVLAPMAYGIYEKTGAYHCVLLGHREGIMLVVQNGIKSAADLKGKTIAVPHQMSTHRIMLERVLADRGLSVKDVKLRVTAPPLFASEMKAGKHQAHVCAEPFSVEAIKRKIGKPLLKSEDFIRHHVDCVFIVRDDVSDKAVQILVESFIKAGMYITSYPRQAAEIGEKFLGEPKKHIMMGLTQDKGHITYWDLLPRVEDFSALLDIPDKEIKKFLRPEFAQSAYKEWMLSDRKAVKDKGKERFFPASVDEAKKVIADYYQVELQSTEDKTVISLNKKQAQHLAEILHFGSKQKEFPTVFHLTDEAVMYVAFKIRGL